MFAEDIEEDMTDPRNWEVGDVLESKPLGVLFTVEFKDNDRIEYSSNHKDGHSGWMPLDTDEDIAWLKKSYKFHSRSVN